MKTHKYVVRVEFNNRGTCGVEHVTVVGETKHTAISTARDLVCTKYNIHPSVVAVSGVSKKLYP